MSDTNYKLNNIDLGKCFISRDYFNEVYSSVNTSYKRNALWIWGSIPSEISDTGGAVTRINPYHVYHSSNCGFISPGWKDFHISTSGGNTSIRLLDIQGKIYLWGCYANMLTTGNTASTAAVSLPLITAVCATDYIAQCDFFNNAIKLGKDHTQASLSYIRSDCTTNVWGCNFGGILGDGTTLNQSMASGTVNQTGGSDISLICTVNPCMYTSHSRSGKNLYFWGNINVGTRQSRTVQLPSICGSNNNVLDFCASGATLGVVLDQPEPNLLVMMGYNDKGQLGKSTTINSIGYTAACFSNTNPSLCVKSFSLGICSSFAVASNGTLWAWGDNTYGQLGTNKTVSTSCPIQSIDVNNNWKCVTTNRMGTAVAGLKTDGSLWVWGEVQFVQGDPTGSCVRRSSPVQVGTRKNWVKIAMASCSSTSPTAPTYMVGLTEEDL